MKKAALVAAVLFALIPARSHAQTVTLNITVGQLLNSTGGTYFPNGSLLQLVVDTSSSAITAPTTASYTGGDSNEEVVAQTLFSNSSLGGGSNANGVMLWSPNFSLGSSPDVQGDYLFLRWFPTVTALPSNPSTTGPASGTAYGQYSALTIEYPDDTAAISWKLPGGGANDDLWFLTLDETNNWGYDSNVNSAPANSAGIANLTVVPEPATLSLLAGAAAICAFGLRRRK